MKVRRRVPVTLCRKFVSILAQATKTLALDISNSAHHLAEEEWVSVD